MFRGCFIYAIGEEEILVSSRTHSKLVQHGAKNHGVAQEIGRRLFGSAEASKESAVNGRSDVV